LVIVGRRSSFENTLRPWGPGYLHRIGELVYSRKIACLELSL
jgi:hypothetical protein